MRCYRYMDLHWGIDSLLSGWFKVSSPQDFNDPFECQGNVCGTPPRESLRNFCRGLVRPAHVNEEDVLDKVHRDFLCKFAHELRTRKPLGDRFRVLCMSSAEETTPDAETLMWGHYADGGKGVRIVIDTDLCLSDAWAIQPVTYARNAELPLYDLSQLKDFPRDSSLVEFYARCIFTKGPMWSYENERRLIARKDQLLPSGYKQAANGADLIKLPRESILGIEFGARVTEAEVWAGIERILQSGLSVLIRWARFSSCRYQYDYWRWKRDCFELDNG